MDVKEGTLNQISGKMPGEFRINQTAWLIRSTYPNILTLKKMDL